MIFLSDSNISVLLNRFSFKKQYWITITIFVLCVIWHPVLSHPVQTHSYIPSKKVAKSPIGIFPKQSMYQKTITLTCEERDNKVREGRISIRELRFSPKLNKYSVQKSWALLTHTELFLNPIRVQSCVAFAAWISFGNKGIINDDSRLSPRKWRFFDDKTDSKGLTELFGNRHNRKTFFIIIALLVYSFFLDLFLQGGIIGAKMSIANEMIIIKSRRVKRKSMWLYANRANSERKWKTQVEWKKRMIRKSVVVGARRAMDYQVQCRGETLLPVWRVDTSHLACNAIDWERIVARKDSSRIKR